MSRGPSLARAARVILLTPITFITAIFVAFSVALAEELISVGVPPSTELYNYIYIDINKKHTSACV